MACQSCHLRQEATADRRDIQEISHRPWMFVGEGPGGVEDEYGVPLVGPSGQLLDKALWSVGLTRDRVYVTNIVKCRPKNNRTPTLDEGRHCADIHLVKEIDLVQPKVIVCLGKVAFQYFYGKAASIMRNRGKWFTWRGYPVMPTYHRLSSAADRARPGRIEMAGLLRFQAAVEKAKAETPDYIYQSPEKTNLLAQ